MPVRVFLVDLSSHQPNTSTQLILGIVVSVSLSASPPQLTRLKSHSLIPGCREIGRRISNERTVVRTQVGDFTVCLGA